MQSPLFSSFLPPRLHSGMSRKTDLWADDSTEKLQIPFPIEGLTRTRRFYPCDGRGPTRPEGSPVTPIVTGPSVNFFPSSEEPYSNENFIFQLICRPALP